MTPEEIRKYDLSVIVESYNQEPRDRGLQLFDIAVLLREGVAQLAEANERERLKTFPVCPYCAERVTVSWENHADECKPLIRETCDHPALKGNRCESCGSPVVCIEANLGSKELLNQVWAGVTDMQRTQVDSMGEQSALSIWVLAGTLRKIKAIVTGGQQDHGGRQ